MVKPPSESIRLLQSKSRKTHNPPLRKRLALLQNILLMIVANCKLKTGFSCGLDGMNVFNKIENSDFSLLLYKHSQIRYLVIKIFSSYNILSS